MKNICTICLMFLIWLNFSCEEKHEFEFKEGSYEGIFYRFNPDESYEVANVSLILKDNKFEGSSDIIRYPIICVGTYNISGDEIEFMNSCGPWTADFDWSLILQGKFVLSGEDNNSLVLIKTFENGHHDVYELHLK